MTSNPKRARPRKGRPTAPKPPREKQGGAEKSGERIAKVIARAGVCSRRDAEKMIAEGRVTLNGKVLETPAITVGPRDRIAVDGTPLPEREHVRLWLYHKPRGLITTTSDPEGRPTIFEKLPEGMPRVITVGRLDLNSEGLLLLTNDGALARRLELPETAWRRRYRVRVHGTVETARLEALKDGIEIDNIAYGPIEAALERQVGHNSWLSVTLREGKNREIRRVMEHLGYPVSRLIRVAFGPFQLGQLAPGDVREVKGKVLRDQLGGLGRDLDLPPPGTPTGGAQSRAAATPPKSETEAEEKKPAAQPKARPQRKPARAAKASKRPKAGPGSARVLRGRIDAPNAEREVRAKRKPRTTRK